MSTTDQLWTTGQGVSRTYEEVLDGDHLEWKGNSPETANPVDVKVEVRDAHDEPAPADHTLAPLSCDFSQLSAAERLELAERLWSSVDADAIDWTLTPAQEAEL